MAISSYYSRVGHGNCGKMHSCHDSFLLVERLPMQNSEMVSETDVLFFLMSYLFSLFFQLCRSALRGNKGLQQVSGLPARGQLRGQPLPKLLERCLRGRGVEVRPVQLGGQTSGQRQRGSQARKNQIRQSEVRTCCSRLTWYFVAWCQLTTFIWVSIFFLVKCNLPVGTNTTTTTFWRIPRSSSTSSSRCSPSGSCWRTPSRWRSSRSCPSWGRSSSGTNSASPATTWSPSCTQIPQVRKQTAKLPLASFSKKNQLSVLSSGAATIRLEMPEHMENSLIFHYNLKFYGDDKDNYEGVSLKRFVMQVQY